ncbi:MAG: hypothetical protein CM1200mP2_04460 [Planctomycetaceae bacterium]|nr:MAG: hypothetical protein CM1200mP2_04460 [Planctomycetaceae bacterium]
MEEQFPRGGRSMDRRGGERKGSGARGTASGAGDGNRASITRWQETPREVTLIQHEHLAAVAH